MIKLHTFFLILILSNISCDTQRTKYKCPIGEIALQESIEKKYSDSIFKDGLQFSLQAEAKIKKILEIGSEFTTPSIERITSNSVKTKIDNEFKFYSNKVERILLYRLAYCNLLKHINSPANKSMYPDSIRITLEKEYIEDFNNELFVTLKETQDDNLIIVPDETTPDETTPDEPTPEPLPEKYIVTLDILIDEVLGCAEMELDGIEVNPARHLNTLTYTAELSAGNHSVQLRNQDHSNMMSFFVSGSDSIELNAPCN